MKQLALIFLLLLSLSGLSQPEQQFFPLGDFETVNGEVIQNCRVGFTTLGKLNEGKTNAILWPTWFTGTSAQILDYGIPLMTLDTTGLFLIIVDALGNGVSSSPSNTDEFPDITIADMVRSQYRLITEEFGITKLYAVMGISMGGMQTFEWLVRYPNMMEKAIPIVGTPKQSFFDLLLWSTEAKLIEAAEGPEELETAMKRVSEIQQLHLYTPSYLAKRYTPDSLEVVLSNEYQNLKHPYDYLSQLKAMMDHDIYRTSSKDPEELKGHIEADVLNVVALQDHMVNPIAAMELSGIMGWPQVKLEGDCGHIANGCESDKVLTATKPFLKR